MALPDPSRNTPDPDDTATISGADYAKQLAANVQRLYDMTVSQLGSVAGSANAITASATPALLAAPVNGQTFRLVPAANNTGAVTININGQGAVALRTRSDVALTADTLVAGVPIEFWYDSSVLRFKLQGQTVAEAVASLAATVAASNLWTTILETTIGSPVASIEQTFTADLFEKIEVTYDWLGTSGGGAISLTLRNASGAIVTLPLDVGGSAGTGASGLVDLVIGALGDKVCSGRVFYRDRNGNADGAHQSGGHNATSADRIRIAPASGNLDSGRITIRGRRRTA
jgi:hypothetical protein